MQEITPNVNEEKAAAEVHSYIKDMIAKYHHRPIPTTPAAGNVKLTIGINFRHGQRRKYPENIPYIQKMARKYANDTNVL